MNQMHGVVDGIYQCNNGRVDEINSRIAIRNVPSGPLQPQFSMRPVSTKYALLPIFDRRAPVTEPINDIGTYNIKQTFNPGTAQAPWSGFASNVNDESTLRNQFFALQSCEQPNYVPGSNSDLYNVEAVGREAKQPFPSLFTTPDLGDFNPNPCNLGCNIFDNCTRVQVKNIK
jgi:hypothetical protein